MPRRAPNLMEYFERASSAKKIVSVHEFTQRLQEVVSRKIPLKNYEFRPMPDIRLNELCARFCEQASNDNTFEWVDGARLSALPHGNEFKNGIAIGYDALLDMAKGFEIDARIMYTAFELCENHAIHFAKGQLQKKTKGLDKRIKG